MHSMVIMTWKLCTQYQLGIDLEKLFNVGLKIWSVTYFETNFCC
jgi:hypothetical protein